MLQSAYECIKVGYFKWLPEMQILKEYHDLA